MANRTADAGVEIELPVTPMLDMTFQLLFFFIVTFNPQSLEGQLDFTLPGPDSPRSQELAHVDPGMERAEIELPSDLTVEVKAHVAGGGGAGIRLIVRDTADTGHEIPDPPPATD